MRPGSRGRGHRARPAGQSGRYLAGVEDPVGIERPLDRPHHGDAGRPVLGDEEARLAVPNAVLAGAAAIVSEGALHQSTVELLGAGDIVGIVGVDEHDRMEVAVADVTDDRCREAVRGDVGLVDGLNLELVRELDTGHGNRVLAVVVPEAPVATIPPIVASAPGSTETKTPSGRRRASRARRVAPACTTTSRSSSERVPIAFISRMSTVIPPARAMTWPSSEVPAPNGTSGNRYSAATATIAAASSTLRGHTTMSGRASG